MALNFRAEFPLRKYPPQPRSTGLGQPGIDSQLAMKDGLRRAGPANQDDAAGHGRVTNLITRHPTVTTNSIATIGELAAGRDDARHRRG